MGGAVPTLPYLKSPGCRPSGLRLLTRLRLAATPSALDFRA